VRHHQRQKPNAFQFCLNILPLLQSPREL